jgi:hypothetical protein
MGHEKGRFKPQVVKLNDTEAAIRIVQRNGEVIDFLIDSTNIPLISISSSKVRKSNQCKGQQNSTNGGEKKHR